MISDCCENKNFEEALDLLKIMVYYGVKPDPSVLSSAIISCFGQNNSKLGCSIHGLAIKDGLNMDSVTASSLIEFYSKFGQPDMAKVAYSEALQKNLVLWNSLISCYSQNNLPDVAMSLLPELMKSGLCPDSITITTIIATVSQMASLLKGKTMHSYYIRRFHLAQQIQVENALIDMYIKSGCLKYAEQIFRKMSRPDIVAWNLMIAGYGSHSQCAKAIDLYTEMRNSGTSSPDEITFLSLISSCNHCGFTDEGLNKFQSMREHGVEPKLQHYVNIVDLLGRAGRLNDAYAFIQDMTIAPTRAIWLSLLAACRVRRDLELGELAANKLIEMDPNRGSNYTQLLNLYVEAGFKEKAANLRILMKQKGLAKVPGCSWIEIRDKVDVFFSGNSTSHKTVKIYEILDSLKNSMKRKECCEEDYIMYEPG